MSVKHFYVPAPGQTDAADRAAALDALLADTAIASTTRYVDRIPSLPAVVCDHGDDIIVIPEPTTLAEVRAAHDELLREHLPTDAAYIETVANAVTAHTTATGNPHGITPGLIGAATTADIDSRLAQVIDTAPAALDTLNELAAAIGDDANFASTVTTQLAGKASTGHNHDAAYSATGHGHSYAAPMHSHALADLPSTLATDAEVAAGYATTGHTHGAAAPAAHAASHASAGTDAITPANIGASATGHTHSYAATSHSHVDADLPAGIARDTEVTAAVTAHEALADPHPTYLTQTEGDTRYRQSANALVDADIPAAIARDAEVTSAVSTHAGQAHTVDQPPQAHDIVSKHTAAGLTAGHVLRASGATTFSFSAIADTDIPATIARDSEVTSAISAHAAAADPHIGYATDTDLSNHTAAADPHTGYQKESEKAAASGYASLDATTRVPTAQLGSGTANNTVFLRGDQTWATPPAGGGGTPSDTVASETAFGVSAAAGTATAYARGDHTHGSPTNPVVAHEAAGDPHPVYLTQTEGDGRYRQTATALVDADIPATIARDAEVAAAYSPIAHTHVTPAAGVLRKTANQTMTATAATDVADMGFAVAANATYYFRTDIAVTTSTGTSPTTNWGFTGPAGATVAIVGEIDTSTSIEFSGVISSFTTFGAQAQVANTGAKFQGVIVTGATAGTVQLQAARGGTTPSMVVAAGSNGLWMRVA